jgi:MFS family permease
MGTLDTPITSRGRWMALTAALLGWMFDGFEMGIFGLVARPAFRELSGITDEAVIGHWFGVVTAGFLVGAATGGVLFGWLGDRLGRVRAMMLSILTYAVFTGCCGLATSAVQIAAFRFIAALGMGGEWSLGVALVMEIWPGRSRAWLAGVIGAAANLGFALVAVLGILLSHVLGEMHAGLLWIGLPEPWVASLTAASGWRLFLMLGAAPALLTFLIQLFVPESGRWLHEKARGATSHWDTRDLLGVVVGAAGACGIIVLWAVDFSLTLRLIGTVLGLAIAALGCLYPLVRYLQRARAVEAGPRWQPTVRRMLFAAFLSGVPLLGTWGSNQWVPLWADQMTERIDPVTHVKTTNPTAKGITQFWGAMGAVVGTVLAALLGSWIGRRVAYSVLCVGALACCLAFYQLFTQFGPAFLVMVFFAGLWVGSFYGWIPLYFPELFPTRVRSICQGFSYNFGRILAAVGTLQTGNLLAFFGNSYPKACSIVSLIYLVGVVLIWFGPETHGQPLPE